MDPVAGLVLCLLIALLAGLALRTDASPTRLCGLSVDGRPAAGARIVRVQRHLNGRCGLLNHAGLSARDGLFFAGSRAIHTRGMLFPIDLVFLDASGRILAVEVAAAPGRAKIRGPRGSSAVLELAAGAARQEFGLEPGQVLALPL